ncbi:hypothetical protein QR680_007183 [Steinernema hermaphroditum]|uniref:PLAT domain-containing protein n=1 Tax=Steinernema hermaphroditum TaxID=289476 RepID=A0AA39HXW7_9BILA|nr:hypothetical protein QR680_007183 [Steinernema hermaphroditum]
MTSTSGTSTSTASTTTTSTSTISKSLSTTTAPTKASSSSATASKELERTSTISEPSTTTTSCSTTSTTSSTTSSTSPSTSPSTIQTGGGLDQDKLKTTGTDKDCFINSIKIFDLSLDGAAPTSVKNASELSFTSDAQAECTDGLSYLWAMYDNEEMDQSDLLITSDKKSVSINGTLLSDSSYKLCLTVKSPKDEKSTCGYFAVSHSYFTVSFGSHGNSMKVLEKEMFVLDPLANTVTVPAVPNVTYEWFCREKGSGEYKKLSGSGCFKEGYEQLPWNLGRVEFKDPSEIFKKIPGSYELKVVARGNRSDGEEVQASSEIEIDLIDQNSDVTVSFSCQPDCVYISNRNSHKISVGYQRSVDVDCKNCDETRRLDHVRYRVMFNNGSFTEWEKSTDLLDGDDRKIRVAVSNKLMPEKLRRNDVKSFEQQATVIVEKEGRSFSDVFTQTYDNNQGPADGECSIDNLTPTNTENVTMTCGGWTDEDGISSYNIYSQYNDTEPYALVASSNDPSQTFKLRTGEYKLFVRVLDGLRAESEVVHLGKVVVTKEQMDLDDAIANANGIHDVANILDELKNQSTLNDFVNGKMDTTKHPWASELIEYSKNKSETAKVIDALRKSFAEQLAINDQNLTEAQIQQITDKILREQNSKLAEAMGGLLKVTANKNPESPEDVGQLLGTVNEVLQNSMKFTMKKRRPGDAAKGEYKVFFARMRIKGTNLIVVNAQINIDGTTTFIQGDIQPAKGMNKPGDAFELGLNYMLLNGVVALMDPIYDIRADTKTEGISEMLDNAVRIDFFGENEGFVDGKHVAWNVTYDKSKDQKTQNIANSSFTTYTYVLPGSSIVVSQVTHSTKKLFFRGEKMAVSSVMLNVEFNNEKRTLLFKNGLMEILNVYKETFDAFIHDTEWTNKKEFDARYKMIVQDTIKLENMNKTIVLQAQESSLPVELKLDGEYIRLQTGFEDVPLLPIAPTESNVGSSKLVIEGGYLNRELFSEAFNAGKTINVPEGYISIDGGMNLTMSNGQMTYEDGNLKFGIDPMARTQELTNVNWTLNMEGQQIVMTLTRGTFNVNLQPHFASVLDVGPGQRIFLDGGEIARNCSNCLVVKHARISHMGDLPRNSASIEEQSIIDQDSITHINTVLEKTDNYLKNNADKLSDAELKETTESVLGIIGKTAKAIRVGLQNPLNNDLASSLAYEKENYDEIFIPLPENPEEEWAEEAVRLRQKRAAIQMMTTAKKLFTTLEDALIKRALDSNNLSPIVHSVGGSTLALEIGLPNDLLSKEFICDEWRVKFPPRMSLMNVYDVGERELIRTSMICMAENMYMYSDNAKYLVSSGTLELKLKRMNGREIMVHGAIEPIMLRTDPKGEHGRATEMLPFKFEPYQVLDYHTFRTIQWNSSITIEFEPNMKLEKDVWIFVAFQRLPGPLPHDHDWRFNVKEKRFKSHFPIPAPELWNRTGLFYVGVGTIAEGDDAKNPNKSVLYQTSISKNWVFDRKPSFDYKLKAINKGCYFFNDRKERFDSTGMDPQFTMGTKDVKCHADHLTTFSVGLFTPEVSGDFTYRFIRNYYERRFDMFNATTCLVIGMLIALFFAIRHDVRDRSKGGIQPMKDNRPADHYLYLVVVETGYGRYCSTDSGVFFNITGTEYTEVDRKMKGMDGGLKSFLSGRTDRFLMTTHWPLGELRTLRIWIDSTGMDHRQSWYCKKVTFLDVQTEKTYDFDVNNWMGIQNGDGQTARSVNVTEKRDTFADIISWHSMAEHISWFNMWNGGGMRTRYRCTRVDRCLNVLVALLFVCFTNALHCKYKRYERRRSIFTLGDRSFTFEDFLYGCLYALMGIPTTILFPILLNQCLTKRALELRKKSLQPWQPEMVIPERKLHGWHPYFAKAFRLIWWFAAIVLYMAIVHTGISTFYQENITFGNRWFISVTTWFAVDAIKAFFCSMYCTMIKRNYSLINDFELSLLTILPLSSFAQAPESLKDQSIGEIVAQVAEIREDRENRMRDEQLFRTTHEVVWFFICLIILLGLSYFSRDGTSYMYQSKVRALLNIDIPTTPPKNGTSFMRISKASDFWTWARKDLVSALRVNWNDGKPAFGMRGFMNDKASRCMGYGTIRQIRSKYNENCNVLRGFDRIFDHCNGRTSTIYEDTQSYDLSWSKHTNITDEIIEYYHRSEDELMGKSFWGYHDSYTGGGYVTFLNGSATALRDKFHRLEREKWIDDRTRAIFVEFSAYNAQVNMYIVVQLLVEVPLSGAYHPSAWIEAVRLEKYVGSTKNIVIAFEVAFVMYTIFSIAKEALIVFFMGRYFGDFWHVIDLTTMSLAVAAVMSYLIRLNAVLELSRRFQETNGNLYVRLDKERDLELNFLIFIGAVIFFSTIRMIKILSFNRRIGVLAITLQRAFWSMISFGMCFTIIAGAFNTALYLLLFSKVETYRNMPVVVMTTFVSVLGKFNASDVLKTNMLAGVIFMMFMLVSAIFLLNAFVMIVMYEFEKVRRDPELQSNDYEILSHVANKTRKALGMLERHHLPSLGLPDVNKVSKACDDLLQKGAKLQFVVHYSKAVRYEPYVQPHINGRLGSLIH